MANLHKTLNSRGRRCLTWSFFLGPPCCILIDCFLRRWIFLFLGGASSATTTRWEKCWRRLRTWERRDCWDGLTSFCHSVCLSLSFRPYFQHHTHSGFDIPGEEAWCLRGRFFLCLHHQTPPSRCPPSLLHLDLLKFDTQHRGHELLEMHRLYGCTHARLQLPVCPAHLDGHIQGKDSESARSSRHTLLSLPSGWLQSGAAHLTPGGGGKFVHICVAFVEFYSKQSSTAQLNTEMQNVNKAAESWDRILQLLVVVVLTSRSWGDSLVLLQWQHWI